MNDGEDEQLFLAVLIRLGYVNQQQLAVGEGTLTVDAIEETVHRLLRDGILSEERLEIAKRLATQLPNGASDEQIDEVIIDAFASLDRTLNPSLIESPTNFDTQIDPRIEHSERTQDPNATLLPDDEDPFKTMAMAGLGAESSVRTTDDLRFRLIRKHAEGGLGMVSLATDVDFGREVAVKEIKERFADIPDSRSRFIYEAEITGRLEHPGIVPVYAIGRYEDGRPYYAMRFVTGSSLAAEVKELHLPENPGDYSTHLRSLLTRFQSVCSTIEYAHSRGVVHRDLKPDNIMMGEYGENLVVDWGLAKSFRKDSIPGNTTSGDNEPELDLTQAGSIVGTPYYMSPEQASGDSDNVGPQADVYSLGATLYHLLTGQAPYRDTKVNSVSELLKFVRDGTRMRSPRSLDSRIPKTLNAICMAALEVKLENRYQSAAALAKDIERFLADDRVSVAKETVTERLGRWTRKNRSWTMAIAASVLVIAAAASIASVVTLQALNETELANQKLGNQLSLARLEQDFDSEIVLEEKRQTRTGLPLADLKIPKAVRQDLQSQITSIEETRALVAAESPADAPRRQRLLNSWANSIDMVLSRPSFTFDAEKQAASQISDFADSYQWKETKEFQDRLEELRSKLKRRRDDWRPITFDGYDKQDFIDEGDLWRRVHVESSDEWPVLIGRAPQGDVSLEIKFGANVGSQPLVGLILNSTEKTSYRFVIAEDNYEPGFVLTETPIQELSDLGQLRMYIVRQDDEFDFTILRSLPITLDKELRLRVRREGVTKLTFSAGGSNVIEFEDPFPIPVSEPGQLGVIAPPASKIEEPVIRFHKFEQDPDINLGPIQLGDALMAAKDIDGARAEYSKLPDDVEALFKKAITFEEEDEEEEIALLRKIVYNFSPEGSLDERTKRWYLNASVRLMNKYMNQGKRTSAAVVQDRVWPHYSIRDVQRLVPSTDRAEYTKMMMKPGQRWRIAYVNEGDADSLRQSIDLFSDSPGLRRDALWRWCDAVRCDTSISSAQGRSLAIPAMKEMIQEVKSLKDRDVLEYTTMVGDLVWMLLVEEKDEEALKWLESELSEPTQTVALEFLPFVLERARILYRQGKSSAAKKDLITMLDRINPKTQQTGIHYDHYSEAYGLLGVILEDEGKLQEAKDAWIKGRRTNWHTPITPKEKMLNLRGKEMVLEDNAIDEILVSWGTGYSKKELEALIDSIFSGSGIEDQILVNVIQRTDKIPQDWLQLVAESFYRGPRGHQAGREFLLRQNSMRDITTYGAKIMLYQAVVLITFGEENLSKYPDMDETLYEQVEALVDKFQTQAFQQKEMLFILQAWTGQSWNSPTFESLAARIDDQVLSASLAFVFAIQMIKYEDRLELGQKIWDKYVAPHQDVLPGYYAPFMENTLRSAKAKLDNANADDTQE